MFDQKFISFFEGLNANNHKEWFDENRKVYEKEVKAPFKALIEKVINYISVDNPTIQIAPKDAIFRINRDIRFSKDKTPYKTHVSASIAPGGRKATAPGFYIQMSPEKLFLGGGIYTLDKDTLKKVRSEIMYEEKAFVDIISNKKFTSYFGQIQGDKNKVLPAEFKEAAKSQPLLFNKQFYYMAELPPSHITKPNLYDLIIEYYEVGKPFNHFIHKALE